MKRRIYREGFIDRNKITLVDLNNNGPIFKTMTLNVLFNHHIIQPMYFKDGPLWCTVTHLFKECNMLSDVTYANFFIHRDMTFDIFPLIEYDEYRIRQKDK